MRERRTTTKKRRRNEINAIALTNPETRIWRAQSVLLLKIKKGTKTTTKNTHKNTTQPHTQNDEIKLPLSPPSSSYTRDHSARPPASNVEFCRRGWRLQPPQNYSNIPD